MRIILEEVEGSHYQDIILSNEEAKALVEGKLIEAMTIVKYKRYHVGVRVGEEWRYASTIEAEKLAEQAGT